MKQEYIKAIYVADPVRLIEGGAIAKNSSCLLSNGRVVIGVDLASGQDKTIRWPLVGGSTCTSSDLNDSFK